MFETQCFNFWTCLLLAKFNQCLAFQLHNLFVIVSYWNLNHINNELCSIKVSNNTIEHTAHQICCTHFLLFHLDLLCVTSQKSYCSRRVHLNTAVCSYKHIFRRNKNTEKIKTYNRPKYIFPCGTNLYFNLVFELH